MMLGSARHDDSVALLKRRFGAKGHLESEPQGERCNQEVEQDQRRASVAKASDDFARKPELSGLLIRWQFVELIGPLGVRDLILADLLEADLLSHRPDENQRGDGNQ